MKRWMPILVAVLVGGLFVSPKAYAEDKEPVSLTVVNDKGEQYDLIEKAGGDALIVFVDPEKFKDEDAADLEEALNAIAESSEDNEADDMPEDDDAAAKAVRGMPGVVRLEEKDDDDDADDADEAADKDDIEVVVVVLTANKDIWDHIHKTWHDAQFHIVLADPTKDDKELDAFELPDGLVWAACLVTGSEVAEHYSSVKDIEEDEGDITEKLNKDDDPEA